MVSNNDKISHFEPLINNNIKYIDKLNPVIDDIKQQFKRN